jgi:hypothetical protein
MAFSRFLIFLSFSAITNTLSSQVSYVLPNEVVLYSFKTENGKVVTINKDKDDNYLVYRFGTKSKIELQYPAALNNNWKDFFYSYYLRGGGPGNEGLDLNYLYFINEGFKYVVYENYEAITGKTTIGIKIINVKTSKTTAVTGITKTRKGSLAQFRDNNLISKSDELFE